MSFRYERRSLSGLCVGAISCVLKSGARSVWLAWPLSTPCFACAVSDRGMSTPTTTTTQDKSRWPFLLFQFWQHHFYCQGPLAWASPTAANWRSPLHPGSPGRPSVPSDAVFSRKLLERNHYAQVQITKETRFKEQKESMMTMNQHKVYWLGDINYGGGIKIELWRWREQHLKWKRISPGRFQ